MKRCIYAMSWNRQDLAAWIEEHRVPVTQALTQLYLFPNSQYENHWRQEVWAGFHTMKRLKGTNKLPSATFIYDNIWGRIPERMNSLMKRVIYHEHDLQPRAQYSEVELETLISNYFIWISNELSKSDVLYAEEVYQKLDELEL